MFKELVSAVVAAALVAVAPGVASAAHSINPTPDGIVMGVSGELTDINYLRASGDTRWRQMDEPTSPAARNREFDGPPAVVYAGGFIHYVGYNSRNAKLLHRAIPLASVHAPKAELSRIGWRWTILPGQACLRPSASAAPDGTVTVACIGRNRHVYSQQFDGNQQHPSFSQLVDLNIGYTPRPIESVSVTQGPNGPVFLATERHTPNRATLAEPNTWIYNHDMWEPANAFCIDGASIHFTGSMLVLACNAHENNRAAGSGDIRFYLTKMNSEGKVSTAEFLMPGLVGSKIGLTNGQTPETVMVAMSGITDHEIRWIEVGFDGPVRQHKTQLSGETEFGVSIDRIPTE